MNKKYDVGDVECFVISWNGMHHKAEKICKEISKTGASVFCVYSNKDERSENGTGAWISVPNNSFFGAKSKVCFDRFSKTIMLQIQADADCSDWESLLYGSLDAYNRIPNLAIWAPNINFTPWTDELVTIVPSENMDIRYVAQTDAIVWALKKDVVKRLVDYDYQLNNLGWGIDWAAISYSYANGFSVVVDDRFQVQHPQGSGYGHDLARNQAEEFLKCGLLEAEKVQYQLLAEFVRLRARAMLDGAKRKKSVLGYVQKFCYRFFSLTCDKNQ